MKQIVKIFSALVAPLLLAGCLLVPGKFDSKMTLMKDGEYSFIYNGEMQIFSGDDTPLGKRPYAPFDPEGEGCSNKIDNRTGKITPLPYPSYSTPNDADAPFRYEQRDCTKKEINEKKLAFEQRDERRKKEDAERMAMFGSVLGGAIPGDDKNLEKFARQLTKYDGWNKVEYLGDNKFYVEYAVSGRFDQNFAFPSIPGATMQFPFVQIIQRSSGQIEIMTPAMSGPGGLFGALAMKEMAGKTSTPDMSSIDGSFTIETTGEVLSNNSKDGYDRKDDAKIMTWKVGGEKMPGEGPRALVKLD